MHSNHLLPIINLGAVIAISISCGTTSSTTGTDPQHAVTGTSGATRAVPKTVNTTLNAIGLDGSAIDRSVNPCDDFYQFACGAWEKKTTIPEDKSRWLRSFSVIDERNELTLHDILEKASTTKEPANDIQRNIGAYYRACMNEAAIESQKLTAITPLLTRIDALRDGDLTEVSRLITELHRQQVWVFFSIDSSQDYKDATQMIGEIDQAGLGLPDRDYYFRDDEKSKALREQYRAHVAKMLELSGMSSAKSKTAAVDVMEIETALAKVSKTVVERRDPQGLYNKIDRQGVEKTLPRLAWAQYFEGIGQPTLTSINVTSVPFLAGVDELLAKIKTKKLRSYFRWHVIDTFAETLPKAFVDQNFKMQQALTGQKAQRPRWKRCVDATDAALGEWLAQPFIETMFAGDSKTAAERMVHEIGIAFGERVQSLEWMNEATRARAVEKLKKMAYLIGYPSKWKSYSFEIGPNYTANVIAAHAFELKRELDKIGKPVERDEWVMSPPTVNAYYHPLKNHMVFPAGILQPPFYSARASLAVNLGAMGMVVGHELTHGFDDEGSQFDGDGNLKNWWDEEVAKKFKAKNSCVEAQYSNYDALPGLKVNGKLTLGENIADMGGVKLAYRALKQMTAPSSTTIADGFTEDQQFFLAVGQAWCAKYREEFARMAAQVDPHAPPRYRVNGSLSNLPEFAEAFSCAPKTAMNPEQRCQVW